MIELSEHEQRLIKVFDRFIEISQGILDGTLPVDEQPSAARLREIRVFLERNEVTLAFILKSMRPTSRPAALPPLPFKKQA